MSKTRVYLYDRDVILDNRYPIANKFKDYGEYRKALRKFLDKRIEEGCELIRIMDTDEFENWLAWTSIVNENVLIVEEE